jgi:hypothetical protein
MMMANPFDFMDIKLKSYLSENIRKSDFINLQAIPVLFHSGYLTVDNIAITRVKNADTKKSSIQKNYTFKLPNNEVASSYTSDFFRATLGKSSDELSALGKELRQAFLERKAQTICDILNIFLSSNTFHNKINDENAFHLFVKSICHGMGLTVLSEVPGAVGRLDMAIELSDKIFVIIELKFCPKLNMLTEEDKNRALAIQARVNIPKPEIDKTLSTEVQEKLGLDGVDLFLSNLPQEPSPDEMDSRFAQEAKTILSPAERYQALATLAREKFGEEAVNKILADAAKKLKSDDKQIETKLSGAVQQALKQIVEKDYHGPFKLQAKEFIDLGLALYGDGLTVKAAFGPR